MISGLAIRAATRTDIPALEALIALSARILSRDHYDERQAEAAIAYVFGVDTDLVDDGSYLVAEVGGALAGCGGWSRRGTLFGGDRYADRSDMLLDPAHDRAKIRAFFVHPDFARRGVASGLLRASEAAARAAGFTATELMATLPGVPFYLAQGYRAGEPISLAIGEVAIDFAPMSKDFLTTTGISAMLPESYSG